MSVNAYFPLACGTLAGSTNGTAIMNNEQFRKLVATPASQSNGAATPRSGNAPSLGAKKSSFIPMTPRHVGGGAGVDFARQVRERNAALKPAKKFRSSAPKGTKYGAEYTDRAKARAEDADAADDKAERIQALEDQMKLDQITPEMFYAMRDSITGGDASSTHLVKGLDRQLLERVRRGEDVMGVGNGTAEEEAPSADVDDELDKLAEKEVEAVAKEKVKKQGTMAPPSPVAGKKRTRDELMAELKAQRKAAAEAREAAQPKLNDKWTKLGDKKKSKVEIDERGREVLITVDENGVVKKRVRKPTAATEQTRSVLSAPDANKVVLGADFVPVPPKEVEATLPEVDEDEDIFEGVGADYDPLALGTVDYDEDSEYTDDEKPQKQRAASVRSNPPSSDDDEDGEQREESPMPVAPDIPSDTAHKPPPSRNYFGSTTTEDPGSKQDHLAGIQEVLKKAAKMDPLKTGPETTDEDAAAEAARLKRRADMLANQDRDLEDMDMGFGSSRFEDGGEEDGEGKKMKLSEWKGGAGDELEEDGKSREKKKRKPKKRKGDANNMSDIMRVIEGRKTGGAE
jgi:hypothetical protein